ARIGGVAIDLQSFGAELARQRHVEARTQVSDEALDLALGPGSIGLAQPWHEAVVVREVEEGAVVAMQPWSVAIPIGHHRPHVVVKHLARDPAEEVERPLVASEQRLHSLIGDELDVAGTAPTQRSDEHRQPILATSNRREVSLHLVARFGLEPYQWFRFGHRSQRR